MIVNIFNEAPFFKPGYTFKKLFVVYGIESSFTLPTILDGENNPLTITVLKSPYYATLNDETFTFKSTRMTDIGQITKIKCQVSDSQLITPFEFSVEVKKPPQEVIKK